MTISVLSSRRIDSKDLKVQAAYEIWANSSAIFDVIWKIQKGRPLTEKDTRILTTARGIIREAYTFGEKQKKGELIDIPVPKMLRAGSYYELFCQSQGYNPNSLSPDKRREIQEKLKGLENSLTETRVLSTRQDLLALQEKCKSVYYGNN